MQPPSVLTYFKWWFRQLMNSGPGVEQPLAKSGASAGQATTPLEWVAVPGGTFQMGCNSQYSNERPVHQVTLDGFLMNRTLITRPMWQDVMGRPPPDSGNAQDSAIVTNVTHEEATLFCKKVGGDLPTEAQWEYVAQAILNMDKVLQYRSELIRQQEDEQEDEPAKLPVSYAAPINKFGIHYLFDEYWEWVRDWYGPYAPSAQHNPTGPKTGEFKVTRGMIWRGFSCFAASRDATYPDTDKGAFYRFRCVKTAK